MCSFPRVSIGVNHTTTVSELASLAVFGGMRLLTDFCLEPLLCQPFCLFRANARVAAFLWVLGNTDRQRSTQTRFAYNQFAVRRKVNM